MINIQPTANIGNSSLLITFISRENTTINVFTEAAQLWSTEALAIHWK